MIKTIEKNNMKKCEECGELSKELFFVSCCTEKYVCEDCKDCHKCEATKVIKKNSEMEE